MDRPMKAAVSLDECISIMEGGGDFSATFWEYSSLLSYPESDQKIQSVSSQCVQQINKSRTQTGYRTKEPKWNQNFVVLFQMQENLIQNHTDISDYANN